jgi:hypothetical protein
MDKNLSTQQRIVDLPFGVVVVRASDNQHATLLLLVPVRSGPHQLHQSLRMTGWLVQVAPPKYFTTLFWRGSQVVAAVCKTAIRRFNSGPRL